MFDIIEGNSTRRNVCDNRDASLFMPVRDDSRYGKKLSSSLIAAVPKNVILEEAFNVLSGIMTSGEVPHNNDL